MTVREIAAELRAAGIDSALHEALLLAEKFTGRSYAGLRACVDEPLPASDSLNEAVRKRRERYPLQYILGEWEFMGLSFDVNESCLIPRSDTEILCEHVVQNAPSGGTLLDLCTGSGCIAAAVLHYRPDMTGAAVELYPDTLRQAERNFRKLGVAERIRTIEGDVTTDVLPSESRYDVISANPPYVTAEEMTKLAPELSAEPARALTDGGDGLSILRAVVEIYAPHLTERGFMILEHGAGQAAATMDFCRKNGLRAVSLRDYGGNDRAVVGYKAR